MSLRDDIIRDAYSSVAVIQEILERAPECFTPNPRPASHYLTVKGVKEWLEQLKAPLAPARSCLKAVVSTAAPTNAALPALIAALENHEKTTDQVLKNVAAVGHCAITHLQAGLIEAPWNKRPEHDLDGYMPREPYRRRDPDTGAFVADMRNRADRIEEHVNRTTPVMVDFARAVEADCRAIVAELIAISEASQSQPQPDDAPPPARKPAPTPFPLYVASLAECIIAPEFTDSGWRYWARTANNQFKELTGADKAAIRRVLEPWAKSKRITGLKGDDRRRFGEWFYQWFAVPDNPDPLGDTKGNPIPQWRRVERPAPSDPILRNALELQDYDAPTIDAKDRRDDDDDGDE